MKPLLDHIQSNLIYISEASKSKIKLPDHKEIKHTQGTYHINFDIDKYAKYIDLTDAQYNIIDASSRKVAEKRYDAGKDSIIYAIEHHREISNILWKHYLKRHDPYEEMPEYTKSEFLEYIRIEGFSFYSKSITVNYAFDASDGTGFSVSPSILNTNHKLEHILFGAG